jgi:hypothetical protein
MRRSADTWARLGILLVAVGVPSSCLLTSSFDGLTSGPSLPDAGSTSSTSSSSSGEGGASSVSAGADVSAAASGTGGGGSTASFPTTSVLDNFDRLDGPLGNGWLIDAALGASLNSHQLVMNNGTDGVILWPKSFGADQEAFITFEKTNPDDFEIELILKSQADSGECDALELAYHPPMLLLYSCNSDGSGTQIGDGLSVMFEQGDQLGGRALADGTVQAFKNGALITTWSAAGWIHHAKGGRIGLGTYGLKSANKFDNFGGGMLP